MTSVKTISLSVLFSLLFIAPSVVRADTSTLLAPLSSPTALEPEECHLIFDQLPKNQPRVVRQLVNILDSNILWQNRVCTISMLGKLRAASVPAIPSLVKFLQHKNSAVVQFTALALGKLGPHASPVDEEIIPLLSSKNRSVRLSAAQALTSISTCRGLAAAEPVLVALAADSDPTYKKAVKNILESLEIAKSFSVNEIPKGAPFSCTDVSNDPTFLSLKVANQNVASTLKNMGRFPPKFLKEAEELRCRTSANFENVHWQDAASQLMADCKLQAANEKEAEEKKTGLDQA